jgi:hypothetical protein
MKRNKEREQEKAKLQERLNEIRNQEMKELDERRKEMADQALTNVDFLLKLVPDHDGNHDDSGMRDHDENCRRCFLLMAQRISHWNPENELEIGILGVRA